MQKKDEIFSKFIEFKALVEKETTKKVKAFKRNNGGEYISNELKKNVQKKAFNESLQPPTTHNRMGWLRGRIVAL